MLPLLLPCEFPKAESLAGVWRSAGSGLLYISWSGVEWSGRHSFLPRAGWLAIYLSLLQHWRIGAIGIPRELRAVGCVRFVGGGFINIGLHIK